MILILGGGPISNRLVNEVLIKESFNFLRISNTEASDRFTVSYEKAQDILKEVKPSLIFVFWRKLPQLHTSQDLFLRQLSKTNSYQVVLISSVSVYGSMSLDENRKGSTLTLPINEYGENKLEIERYFEVLSEGKLSILRVANIYGDLGFHDLVNTTLDAGLNHKNITLKSPQLTTRNFLYINHLISFLKYLCTFENIQWPTILNVGGHSALPIEGMVDLVSKVSGMKVQRTYQDSSESEIRESNPDCRIFLEWCTHHEIEVDLISDIRQYVNLWMSKRNS